jgi:hypothetical protein
MLQAYEKDLITEETAMLYATNKPVMRQMLDIARARPHHSSSSSPTPQMLVVPSRQGQG